jgi:hypothetical protein
MSSHNVEVYGFETQIPDEWLLSKDDDEWAWMAIPVSVHGGGR